MIVAMGLAAVVAGRRLASTRARVVVAGILAAMTLGLVAWGGGDVATRIAGHGFTELRPRIWRDSLAIVRDFPLTGSGLNTFGTAMLSYQSSKRDLQVREAHNDYLQVAAEGGLLLGVPAALALAALARATWRRFRDGADDTMTHWVRVGAATGLVAIGLQSLVEFSLQMPGNAAFAAALMAIALHEPPPRRERR
jgi:O-antigen ligase